LQSAKNVAKETINAASSEAFLIDASFDCASKCGVCCNNSVSLIVALVQCVQKQNALVLGTEAARGPYYIVL